MLKKILDFFKPTPTVVEAPYKVEASAPNVEIVPAGTEASVAAPATPKAEPKPKAPAKPKAEPKPKAPAKPKAPRAPAK